MLSIVSNLFKPTRNLFIFFRSNTQLKKKYSCSPQLPITLLPQRRRPSHFICFSSRIEIDKASAVPMPPPSSSKPKIVAEYAKSARSSCKTCSNKIPDKTLRLGLVSKDPRGYDSTKWFHLRCFSEAIESTDVVGGFASLQESEQEALKKLVEALKIKQRKREESEQEAELEEKDAKKIKLPAASEEAKLDIQFLPYDVKDNYKDAKLVPKWKAFQSIIFLERDDGLRDSSKIAAFDFDGCLVKTSVKRVGADEWSLMHSSIPNKLQSLYNDGYKLVIFTNESNIDRWKNKRQVAIDSKIGRLSNFINHVEVPIQVFIACSDAKVEDPFRKPKPGMWQIMEKHFNSGIPIDMDKSFYVGDAAGRPNDFSDSDKKFAQAIGLKFYVPEDYFGF